MTSNSIRVRSDTHKKLKRLAEEASESMGDTLARAVNALERNQWLEGLSEDYSRLRADKAKWERELKDRAAWGIY